MTRRPPDPAELQSDALGRWLDRACREAAAPRAVQVAPPDDIDREVVEAIYALRPDLAPAPRVTADDILASLTAGPLADPTAAAHAAVGQHEAEVVPFPGRAARTSRAEADSAEAEPGPGSTRTGWAPHVWRWFGGTGGVGMALVAAATLVLVVTPVLRSRQDVSHTASPAAPAGEQQAAEREVAGNEGGADAGLVVQEELDRVAASPASAPPGAVASRGVPAAPAAEPAVIPMADAPALGPSTLIPELSEPRTGEAVAGLGAEADGSYDGDAVVAVDDAEPAQAPSAPERAAAEAPAYHDEPDWRSGASGRAVSRADQALAEAERLRGAGDRVGAARALEAAARAAPARVAQHLLGLAAGDWLAAGDRTAARAAAERGLGLSAEDTPERRRLQGILAGL